jgi:hypothetical protein
MGSNNLEEDLITHLKAAADKISEAINLVNAGKCLTAHEKIEIAFKKLLAAESLYKTKENNSESKT